jgi:hypothetical protein
MNEKYEKTWNCIIADNLNFTGIGNHELGKFIWFSYLDHHFVVYKTNLTSAFQEYENVS